jgi:hypothetical protein
MPVEFDHGISIVSAKRKKSFAPKTPSKPVSLDRPSEELTIEKNVMTAPIGVVELELHISAAKSDETDSLIVRSQTQSVSVATTTPEPVSVASPEEAFSIESKVITAPKPYVVEFELKMEPVWNEVCWWPFQAVSKALLQTQRNTAAYLEANRRLVDEMRDIMRKERELLLELSETGRSEANKAFNRAVRGIRELGEAWIDAQVRSLERMHASAEVPREPVEIHHELDKVA